MSDDSFLRVLRGSAPYIHAHHGRTFVIAFGGDAAEGAAFNQFIFDVGLLTSLGVRLVLVHGARVQIERHLAAAGITPRLVEGIRVTDAEALGCVKDAVGRLRMEIEALLSTGLASTSMGGAHVRVAGGNLVIAKPLGIRQGVDYQHTGEVRRIDVSAIDAHLDRGNIVLLSPIGYSPTGEIFNLSGAEIATATATALHADKLVFLHGGPHLHARMATAPFQLDLDEAERLARAEDNGLDGEAAVCLQAAVEACRQGVRRVHLVSAAEDGALLRELYTRDGAGTLIFSDGYDTTRFARIDDVGGILNLIGPLEQAGILVPRSREQLELDIEHFLVMVRDGAIIACAALIPYPDEGVGELACVAVHPDYRRQNRAEALLHRIERNARARGLRQLFTLTTRTPHWFLERGFRISSLDALPVRRRDLYNFKRNSTVLIKDV